MSQSLHPRSLLHPLSAQIWGSQQPSCRSAAGPTPGATRWNFSIYKLYILSYTYIYIYIFNYLSIYIYYKYYIIYILHGSCILHEILIYMYIYQIYTSQICTHIGIYSLAKSIHLPCVISAGSRTSAPKPETQSSSA